MGDENSRLAEEALVRRLAWRLMPLLVLLFFSAFLSRQNVGFAKLHMLADLSISEAAYGFGASLFFIGYVVFEIPSSMALQRYGARFWMALMVLSWGLITLALALTSSTLMFYMLRFLLGVAEAGFYPAAIYYLTVWFPQSHRIRMFGIFAIGSSLGNALGGPINGLLLDLNGVWTLSGWQWVFVGTGIPALVLTVFAFAYLPSSPQTASFLSREEASLLHAARLRDDAALESPALRFSLIDLRIMGFSAVYVLIATSFYGVTYWLPTIVRDFGVSDTVNGALNSIPWSLGILLLLVIPKFARSESATLRLAVVVTSVGTIMFVLSTMLEHNALRFVAMAVGGPCIVALSPVFWSIASRYLTGAGAAVAIAAINSIGNLGGFLAQNLMPWLDSKATSATGAMMLPAICLASLFAVVAFAIGRDISKKRSAQRHLAT